MFRLLIFELQKIWSKKAFLAILITLLGTNIFLLWYTHQGDINTAPLSSYRMLQNDLSQLPNDQRMAFIQQYYDDVIGINVVETVKLYESWQSEQGNALASSLKEQNVDVYEKYLPVWESGNVTTYTNSIQLEVLFAQKIYDEATNVNHYEQYLNEIEVNSTSLSNISIFSKNPSDDFSIHNIEKTVADYKQMHGTPITYDVSYGVVESTCAYTTDILVCVFLLIFASMLIFEEKEKNLFSLIKITPLGKSESILAKILALFINTGIASLLLYGSNLLFFQQSVGLGDLGRSLQSIFDFIGSTLPISIRAYLFLYIIMKWVMCFILGLLALLIFNLVKHTSIAYLLCTGFLFLNYVLFLFIPMNSTYTFIKFSNLYALFQIQNIFQSYLNLNLFGNAISLFNISMFMIFVYLIMLCFFLWLSFIAHLKTPCISFKMNSLWHIKSLFRYRPSIRIAKHEAYKIFILNRALVLLFAFFILIMNQSFSTSMYISPDENYYKTYMFNFQGELNDEKVLALQLEKDRFTQLHKQLDEIDTLKMNDKISNMQALEMSEPITKQLNAERAFERIWTQYEYIQTQSDASFVYESGYLSLFDIEDTFSNSSFLSICIILILCIYRVCSMEYSTKAWYLLSTTAKGRQDILHHKVAISMIIASFACLLPFICNVVLIYNTYGLPSLDASITSFQIYENLPSGISILSFFIILFILKLSACLTIVQGILALSQMTKHNFYSLLLSLLVFIVPILFIIMKLDWFHYVSLIFLFNAGYYLAQGNGILLIAYTIFSLLLLMASSIYLRRSFQVQA